MTRTHKSVLAGLGAVSIACFLAIATAAPASAEFTENEIGCAGHATVTDKGGQTYQVDAEDKTANLPRNGTAAWEGSVGTTTHNHFGEVVIKVGPRTVTLDSWGPKPNTSNQNTKKGTKNLKRLEDLPAGKYELSGFHQGDEGRCAGTITVNLAGSVVDSPVGIAATVLTILTAIATLLAMVASQNKPAFRGRPILGLIAGLLFGLFAAIELVFLKVVGSGSPLLMILPIVMAVIGVVLAMVAPFGRGRVSVSAPAT